MNNQVAKLIRKQATLNKDVDKTYNRELKKRYKPGLNSRKALKDD